MYFKKKKILVNLNFSDSKKLRIGTPSNVYIAFVYAGNFQMIFDPFKCYQLILIMKYRRMVPWNSFLGHKFVMFASFSPLSLSLSISSLALPFPLSSCPPPSLFSVFDCLSLSLWPIYVIYFLFTIFLPFLFLNFNF